MRTIRRGAGISLAAMLLAAIYGASTASAQIYPAPNGYCTISLSAPLPALDSEVVVTVLAVDRAGNRLAGVTGTAEILEQPGTDATLTPEAFTTGQDGTAELTLYTGETPGQVRVFATCAELEVEVTGNLVVGEPPSPPRTGDGPQGHVPMSSVGMALMAGAVGAAFGVRSVRGRR